MFRNALFSDPVAVLRERDRAFGPVFHPGGSSGERVGSGGCRWVEVGFLVYPVIISLDGRHFGIFVFRSCRSRPRPFVTGRIGFFSGTGQEEMDFRSGSR